MCALWLNGPFQATPHRASHHDHRRQTKWKQFQTNTRHDLPIFTQIYCVPLVARDNAAQRQKPLPACAPKLIIFIYCIQSKWNNLCGVLCELFVIFLKKGCFCFANEKIRARPMRLWTRVYLRFIGVKRKSKSIFQRNNKWTLPFNGPNCTWKN